MTPKPAYLGEYNASTQQHGINVKRNRIAMQV